VIPLKKILMVRADRIDDDDLRKNIVTTSLENNISHIFIKREDMERFSKLGNFQALVSEDDGFQSVLGNGAFVSIEEGGDVKRIQDMASSHKVIIVSTRDWKVIPLENLIASFQDLDTRLIAEISTSEEAELFLNTLEVGVDGLLIDPQGPEDILNIRGLFDDMEVERIDLTRGKITSMKQLGMGDRVCIDTCSMLNIGEGMLIGSSSSGMFLVHSESVVSEYVDPRPFRVNAGPVHSYVLVPGGRTKYLSDLKVGDEVLSIDPDGNTRPVIIGRLKIERRPLILLEAEVEGKNKNIILQNAETIRLLSSGEPVSIVDLKVGDEVIMKVEEGGRHFGMRIKETIMEK
jgi:3-dehydroquinate synthase II